MFAGRGGEKRRPRRQTKCRRRRVAESDSPPGENATSVLQHRETLPGHTPPPEFIASAGGRGESAAQCEGFRPADKDSKYEAGHQCPKRALSTANCGNPAARESAAVGASFRLRMRVSVRFPALPLRASHARGRWFEPSRAHLTICGVVRGYCTCAADRSCLCVVVRGRK